MIRIGTTSELVSGNKQNDVCVASQVKQNKSDKSVHLILVEVIEAFYRD